MAANAVLEEIKDTKKTLVLHTFMDFCSGIGGGRLGMTNNNLKCVAYSEIENAPASTYQLFFGNEEKNYGDLMSIEPSNLPGFDLLVCGFPCQTFSIVGKRAGFEDLRGQVIYGIARILKEKQVPCFILENVKGLLNHNKGKTLNAIISMLKNLGYDINYELLDSSNYGVPQMRERVYIVGIHQNYLHKEFKFPEPVKEAQLSDYLINSSSEVLPVTNPTFQKYLNNKYNKNKFDIHEILKEDYTIIDTRQSDLRIYKTKCPTLRTGRHGILYTKNGQLHKLSDLEALLLQGFPHELAIKAKQSGIPMSKLLSQAGNAMTVNVMEKICGQLISCLKV